MPNKDRYHDIVICALQKAGWRILNEQEFLSVGTQSVGFRRLFIDIKAQHEQHQIVLIEVKGLTDLPVHELMELVGQFMVYRAALDYLRDETPLYVAIPQEAYNSIITHPLGNQLSKSVSIPFLIYDVAQEEIIQWMPTL